jgi:hypothetical protein
MKSTSDKVIVTILVLLIGLICWGTYINNAYANTTNKDYVKGRIERLSEEWIELEERQAKLAAEAARLRKDFKLEEK